MFVYLFILIILIFTIKFVSDNMTIIDYMFNSKKHKLSHYVLLDEKKKKDTNIIRKHQELKDLLMVKFVLNKKLVELEKQIKTLSSEIKEGDTTSNYSNIETEYQELISKDLLDNNEN